MLNKIYKINKTDNVAVLLYAAKSNEIIEYQDKTIKVKDNINQNHKIALIDIEQGSAIIKYGYIIGYATKPIKAGEFVHTHNIKTSLSGILEYKYNKCLKGYTTNKSKINFKGYVRENSSIGIRNEIWIINTVGCVNQTSRIIAQKANIKFNNLIANNHIDGIFDHPHPYGCSQTGDDQLYTQKILAQMVNHPNAAGVLVIGLGCENNNIQEFKKVLGNYNPSRVKFLQTQNVADEIGQGLSLLEELVAYALKFKRIDCPIEKLVVGLKCGGSDALSGITANPLVGMFSDILIENGGSTILTEVPEMFGAETTLMERCINEKVFLKTVKLINDFKDYYLSHGQVIYENPSPGNKEGGISTLEEKSLGCTQKSGKQNVVDVLDYGENLKHPGLNLLKSPGNDIVSSTALMASGAQLILFTTGRGTPFGTAIPTIKISSNTELSNRKKSWIDYNAYKIIESIDTKSIADDFFTFVLKIASKDMKAKNEINGYRDIAIFKDGVTL